MAGAKKNFKATKKFEQKHLKNVLEKRKAGAKIKQRHLAKTQKQTRKAADAEFHKGPEDAEKAARAKASKTANVNEMSVDDFFGGGFEIVDKAPKASKSSKKLGKRKRDEPQPTLDDDDDDDDDASDDLEISDAEQPVASDDDGEEDDTQLEDGELGMSKDAMEALAKDDPDFYKFLKENDPDALDFDDADLAEVDELSASEEEDSPRKKRKKSTQPNDAELLSADNELTQEMVARWKTSLTENHSLKAARQVVLAFRSAAHLNEDDEDQEKALPYTISSPEVFHDVLIVALKQIPEVLQHHIPVKESSSGKVYVPTESKKFKPLSMLLRSFTSSILHMLPTLSDDATLKLTLSALTPIVPYLLSFRKLLKNLIKTVVGFWSQNISSDTTRITAFLVLRRLVVIGDKGIREAVLKATYQGLIAGSRVTNANTIQGINLMKNSAAELWGLDQSIGYTTAYNFIRQLAIHLRNSIVHNQNDSYRHVYNWQYVHSLDFWSCVLSEHCNSLREAEVGKESQLRLLIYPLVQVTLGATRLIPTATYFPLRFHMIRSLLRISRSTGTYIPLASVLLEVLNSAEMRRSPKQATLKALDFHVAYKTPKAYLRTRVYQDGVGEQIVDLFAEYFVLWSTNIAFPEFALPVVIMLKRWLKQSRKKASGNNNGKLRSGLVLLVQKLEANAKFIEGKRAKVDFAPRDRTQVDAFLKDFPWEKTPVGAYVVAQRKAGAEKAKMMEEARKEDERKRKEEEQAALEENVAEIESDEEDEEMEDLDDEDEDEDSSEEEDE
ncbi:Noc2p family-domain-containing protein [Xylaria bambusicola]|uniref:Noc2p family-domain-containing protein n=1 Tax=Xylaria bambusicola TaxID=326684 RepID=UPI002007632C|nr:Noc2p family-domain-containing protein [Xylaria bambusicola]KAI0509039.1 Noc2p family-domain-containing protein [Xylaria bambusicola]